jgi:thiol-disulfide isomerase/thioredoxin
MKKPLQYIFIIILSLIVWQCKLFKEPAAAVMSTTLGTPEIEEKEEDKLVEADFNLVVRDLDGNLVKMSDYKGKVIFLNFWATWCMPCVAELPSIEKLHSQFGDDIAFLLISNESIDKVRAYHEKKDYKVPFHVIDDDGKIPNLFYYESIPTTHIINKNGKIVKSSSGAEDWDDDDFIEELKKLL